MAQVKKFQNSGAITNNLVPEKLFQKENLE